MKNIYLLSCVMLIFSASSILSQSPTPSRPRIIEAGNTFSPTPTPRPTSISSSATANPTASPNPRVIVITNSLPSPIPNQTPRPVFSPTPVTNSQLYPSNTTSVYPTPSPTATPIPIFRSMNIGQLKNKIAEAKRLMQARPLQIAYSDSTILTDILRIAFYDWKSNQIDFAVLTKSIFLSKGTEYSLLSSNGNNVTIRIVRANGVNTAVTISDHNNEYYTPLVVQYPIERNGYLSEMAYYTSTHPGTMTLDVINAGKFYVKNTIDTAREKLRQKGIFISPQIADIAERLATVEHIDHPRFWNEYQQTLYNEIFTLYALNEGNTYRFSVSRAGAGGMVQMIPATYYMMRSRYYNVGLIPDFVEGMRNHVNACEAMLLYMQMTWEDISGNQTIVDALSSGIATQQELMAAGYNSNPSRLAIYIRRGGAGWRNLIPNETKVYLQIYSSLQRFVPITPRTN